MYAKLIKRGFWEAFSSTLQLTTWVKKPIPLRVLLLTQRSISTVFLPRKLQGFRINFFRLLEHSRLISMGEFNFNGFDLVLRHNQSRKWRSQAFYFQPSKDLSSESTGRSPPSYATAFGEPDFYRHIVSTGLITRSLLNIPHSVSLTSLLIVFKTVGLIFKLVIFAIAATASSEWQIYLCSKSRVLNVLQY